jgi:hypothetical protein
MLLAIEDARTPTHIGALLVLEGAPLLDTSGHLRLEEIRRRLERRLRRVPVLRQVLYRPGPLLGPPLWVAKVNDVMLALIAGGARALLLHRGEPVEGVALMTSVAVSLRSPDDTADLGNKTGQILVPIPLDRPEPEACLEAIVASTRAMKKKELATSAEHVIAWVTMSGLFRFLARWQHMINLFEDLPVLVEGMERNWSQLSRRHEWIGEGSPPSAP